jgi:YihY family inner membrane protein
VRLIDDVTDRLDRIQRRHAVLGFSHAVLKRYSEDHGGWLGAILTYYGFFALTPLLLVAVTVLSIVFEDNPTLLDRILDAIWSQLPFVGDDIRQSVQPITGNPLVVTVALVVALWGATNVARVCQDTLNGMWGVPRDRRPGFLSKLWRSVSVLALLGLGVIGSAVITGLALGRDLPLGGIVLTTTLTMGANTGIALGLTRLMTARPLSARQMLPGSVIIGVGTSVIMLAGGLYVQRTVARASSLYGSFGAMIGLFALVAVLAQVFVYGTLVNVVREERLWPRSLSGRDLGDGDRRAIALTSQRARLRSLDPDQSTANALGL